MNSTAIEWEAASGSSRSHGDVCNPKGGDLEAFLTIARMATREELRDAEIESAATWCSPLNPTA